jgi:primary-amine oxidase
LLDTDKPGCTLAVDVASVPEARICFRRVMTRKIPSRIVCCIAAVATFVGTHMAAAHPLDPLSADEIASAVAILHAAGLATTDTRFPLIGLDEPAKTTVLGWQPGRPVSRSAFVVARRDRTVYEGVVDLAARAVTRWRAVRGVQTSILAEEVELARRATIADPGWQTAMRKRGYDSFDKLYCAPLPAGYPADPAEEGRRLLKVVCFDTAGGRSNVWGRPIEGLCAVVDLDEGKVIRLVDSGTVPVSRDPADFGAVAKETTPAEDPTGKGQPFVLEGNEVRWENWSYHFRMDKRVGPIVSLVRYDDQGRRRMVLYRGSLAEMFVPYMDSDTSWSFRAYMDVGEFGFGSLASPLVPGIDCPGDAKFIDATLADDDGEPVIVKSRMCLFVRDTGDPLWRHAEFANRTYAGRSATELVLRSIAAIGNYDYAIDWVLTEAGVIRIDVGATGIDAVKGVPSATLADPAAARDTSHGTLIAPNLVAVNHDHFLSFRLDVDIDGTGNTLVRQHLVPERLGTADRRQSLWRVVEDSVGKEGPVRAGAHATDEIWRIVNPNLTNRLGAHPGYELRPGHTVTSLLASDDLPPRRAQFSAAPLWVTAFDPTELYAAGPYPNQSRGDGGLPIYVTQHRPIANADIVLWYTMGFHHVPRSEDWPVMSTIWHSVSLVPDGFFDRNPAVYRLPGETGR